MNHLLELNEPSALAFARAVLPSTQQMPGADAGSLLHARWLLSQVAPQAVLPFFGAQTALSHLALLQTGRRLENLKREEAIRLVARWSRSSTLSGVVFALASVYKIAHFDRDNGPGALGTKLEVIRDEERPRWMHNVVASYELDEELEADVVVVGTGAGGAVVGRQLAARGHAVVFAEEGDLKRRGDFPGTLVGALTQLYDTILTRGLDPILIPRGRLVGGSTAVNGGSSFRPPRWVAQRWALETGESELSLDALTPHFDAVERFLDIAPPEERAAGPFHALFSEGCERLGWQHELIPRNAPGCTGEGFCDNGCRSGARKSTDVSYVPDALDRGAMLLTGLRVDEVLHDKGRTSGVKGWARSESGRLRRVTVRAATVVLATGSLVTPGLLHKNRLGGRSRQLGQNLTVHPSAAAQGVFRTTIDAPRYIPQASFSSQFLHEGLLLLSAQADDHILPTVTSLVGEPLMRLLAERDRVAGVGFLASDEGKGRLSLASDGSTSVRYHLTKADRRRMLRGQRLLVDLLFEAGAERVIPGMIPGVELKHPSQFEELAGQSRFVLSAFHPLGTCKMSPSPDKGVVDTDHRLHCMEGVYVVDGSVVPGPIGVNPQWTIMAWALRAAEKIDRSIEARSES